MIGRGELAEAAIHEEILGEDLEFVDYDPNQPRDPAGTATGGQWSSGEDDPSVTATPITEEDFASYKPDWKKTTKKEADAWQAALRVWETEEYMTINGELREGDELDWSTSNMQTTIRSLDRAHEKLGHVLTEDKFAWRGTNHVARMPDGEYVDRGFVSLTPNEEVAEDFGQMLRVILPKGTRVLNTTNHFEDELLLKRGTRFRKFGTTITVLR